MIDVDGMKWRLTRILNTGKQGVGKRRECSRTGESGTVTLEGRCDGEMKQPVKLW